MQQNSLLMQRHSLNRRLQCQSFGLNNLLLLMMNKCVFMNLRKLLDLFYTQLTISFCFVLGSKGQRVSIQYPLGISLSFENQQRCRYLNCGLPSAQAQSHRHS